MYKEFALLKQFLLTCTRESKAYVIGRLYENFDKELINLVCVKWTLINAEIFDYLASLTSNGSRMAKIYERCNTMNINKMKEIYIACCSFPSLIDEVIKVRDDIIKEDEWVSVVRLHIEVDDEGRADDRYFEDLRKMDTMKSLFACLREKTSEANRLKNAKYMERTIKGMKEWMAKNKFDDYINNWDALITNNETLKAAVQSYWEEVHYNPYPF